MHSNKYPHPNRNEDECELKEQLLANASSRHHNDARNMNTTLQKLSVTSQHSNPISPRLSRSHVHEYDLHEFAAKLENAYVDMKSIFWQKYLKKLLLSVVCVCTIMSLIIVFTHGCNITPHIISVSHFDTKMSIFISLYLFIFYVLISFFIIFVVFSDCVIPFRQKMKHFATIVIHYAFCCFILFVLINLGTYDVPLFILSLIIYGDYLIHLTYCSIIKFSKHNGSCWDVLLDILLVLTRMYILKPLTFQFINLNLNCNQNRKQMERLKFGFKIVETIKLISFWKMHIIFVCFVSFLNSNKSSEHGDHDCDQSVVTIATIGVYSTLTVYYTFFQFNEYILDNYPTKSQLAVLIDFKSTFVKYDKLLLKILTKYLIMFTIPYHSSIVILMFGHHHITTLAPTLTSFFYFLAILLTVVFSGNTIPLALLVVEMVILLGIPFFLQLFLSCRFVNVGWLMSRFDVSCCQQCSTSNHLIELCKYGWKMDAKNTTIARPGSHVVLCERPINAEAAPSIFKNWPSPQNMIFLFECNCIKWSQLQNPLLLFNYIQSKPMLYQELNLCRDLWLKVLLSNSNLSNYDRAYWDKLNLLSEFEQSDIYKKIFVMVLQNQNDNFVSYSYSNEEMERMFGNKIGDCIEYIACNAKLTPRRKRMYYELCTKPIYNKMERKQQRWNQIMNNFNQQVNDQFGKSPNVDNTGINIDNVNDNDDNYNHNFNNIHSNIIHSHIAASDGWMLAEENDDSLFNHDLVSLFAQNKLALLIIWLIFLLLYGLVLFFCCYISNMYCLYQNISLWITYACWTLQLCVVTSIIYSHASMNHDFSLTRIWQNKKTIYYQILMLLPLFTHFADISSDIGAIVEYYKLSLSTNGEHDNSTSGLNYHTYFVITLSMFFISRFFSAMTLYREFSSNWKDAIYQLLDVYIYKTINLSIKHKIYDRILPAQRLVLGLKSVVESSVQALIGGYVILYSYLFNHANPSVSVIISTIFSMLQIANVQIRKDYYLFVDPKYKTLISTNATSDTQSFLKKVNYFYIVRILVRYMDVLWHFGLWIAIWVLYGGWALCGTVVFPVGLMLFATIVATFFKTVKTKENFSFLEFFNQLFVTKVSRNIVILIVLGGYGCWMCSKPIERTAVKLDCRDCLSPLKPFLISVAIAAATTWCFILYWIIFAKKMKTANVRNEFTYSLFGCENVEDIMILLKCGYKLRNDIPGLNKPRFWQHFQDPLWLINFLLRYDDSYHYNYNYNINDNQVRHSLQPQSIDLLANPTTGQIFSQMINYDYYSTRVIDFYKNLWFDGILRNKHLSVKYGNNIRYWQDLCNIGNCLFHTYLMFEEKISKDKKKKLGQKKHKYLINFLESQTSVLLINFFVCNIFINMDIELLDQEFYTKNIKNNKNICAQVKQYVEMLIEHFNASDIN